MLRDMVPYAGCSSIQPVTGNCPSIPIYCPHERGNFELTWWSSELTWWSSPGQL